MQSRFELREVGSHRLLGSIEMVDVVPPGEVVRMFQAGLVLVDHPAPAAPSDVAESPAAAEAGRGRKGRRATA